MNQFPRRSIIQEIKNQFGVDFLSEWQELNEEIGDTGASLDDFYESLEYVMRHTNDIGKNVQPIESDYLFSILEELKEYPEEYMHILSEWIERTNFDPIYMEVELDHTAADEWLDNHLGKDAKTTLSVEISTEQFKYSPFVSPQYYPTNTPTEQTFMFPIYINDKNTETIKADREIGVRPNLWRNNGKGVQW